MPSGTTLPLGASRISIRTTPRRSVGTSFSAFPFGTSSKRKFVRQANSLPEGANVAPSTDQFSGSLAPFGTSDTSAASSVFKLQKTMLARPTGQAAQASSGLIVKGSFVNQSETTTFS